MRPRCLSFVLVGTVLCGCQTTTRTTSEPGEIRIASPARAWELVSTTGEAIGMVLHFRSLGAPEDSLYMVRNLWHQDLGLIDAFGRAYRYLPHHREPAWVGSGTVLQGAERILGAEECGLVEVSFPEASRPPSTPGEHDRRRLERQAEAPGLGGPAGT